MTLRHLQIFVQVYQCQSITKAAKKLYMAQPAVSLAVKELEEHYQILLFERMNRKIYPTKVADKLYDYASSILSLYHTMEEDILDYEKKGELKVGSSITISTTLLPQIIKQFQSIYPKLKIKILINNASNIEKALLENEIDVALVETNVQNDAIIKQPFMKDTMSVIVSPTHPLANQSCSLEDLVNYPFFIREEGSSVSKLIKSVFLSQQIEMDWMMESSSTEAIIKHVEMGLGLTCLPSILVQESLKQNKVVQLDIPMLNLTREYYMIYHRNKQITTLLKDFYKLTKTMSNQERK